MTELVLTTGCKMAPTPDQISEIGLPMLAIGSIILFLLSFEIALNCTTSFTGMSGPSSVYLLTSPSELSIGNQ